MSNTLIKAYRTTILLCCYCAIGCFQIILSLVVPCVCEEMSVRCTSRLRCTNLLCTVILIYASQCYGMLTNNIGGENSIVLYNNNTLFFAAVVIDDID